MPLVEIPVGSGFYEDEVKQISDQQCINWYPSIPEGNAISSSQLKRTPGLSLVATNGTKVCRGAGKLNGAPYFVNGERLYRINSDLTSTDLGEITGTERVSIASNGTQLCIVVPGIKGYIFTASPDTLTEITDTDYTANPSIQVVFKDGYFVHLTATKFFISALNDGLSYNALDFGTAESVPDDNIAIHVNRDILFICGEETIEPFQNVGGADFPFRSIKGSSIQKGVKAKFSVVDFDNSFIFLGGGKNEQVSIWRYSGGGAVRISTHAIDNELTKLTDAQLQAINVNTYSRNGAYFACYHFPTSTFCYDATATAHSGSSKWHERRSRNSSGSPTKWRVSDIVEAWGVTLAGDSLGANIGKLDDSISNEYGTAIDRDFSLGPITQNGIPFIVNYIEMFMEQGAGNSNIEDPVITLRMSKDGRTLGNVLERKIGKTGEYNQRPIWRNRGMVRRFFNMHFSVSGDINTAITKCVIDITVGN